ncbi:MAG: EAL domain-containing protein [Myxococcota bacterium]
MQDAKGTSRPLVLIVEGEVEIRARAEEEMTAAGFRCCAASDAAEALEAFRRERPALVILDVDMGDADGFETCRRLRAEPKGAELPILVVTSSGEERDIENAFAAGASDFATKPIQWPLLRHRSMFLAQAGEAFRRLQTTLIGLAESERRLSDAQRLAHIGNWQWLVERNEMLWSDETFAILGYERGKTPASWNGLIDAIHADERGPVEKMLRASVRAQRGWDIEHRVQNQRGDMRFVHHQGSVDIDPLTGERRVLGTLQDATDRRTNEEKIRRLAFFDSLTGLPNRRLLHQRLDGMLRFARAQGRQVAVLFLDLDHFKRVNDSLGHAAGDRLLAKASARLVESLRASDGIYRAQGSSPNHVLSRVGGDEFVVTLLLHEGPEIAAKVARRILAALSPPVSIEGKEISVTASVGISLFPSDAENADTLMRFADVAMYHAKSSGRSRYQFYTKALSAQADRALLIQGALRRALEARDFQLHYQPQISTQTGCVNVLEALIRWEVPGKGTIPPGEFIGIAEETGFIEQLGEWALHQACRDCREWQRRGLTGVGVAVNLSPLQLRKQEIVEVVRRTLQSTGLEPRFLELELTETALLQHTAEVAQNLDQLKAMGVRLALDDFGTGYASLSYLKRIPFDSLKIDREFIRDLESDAGDRAIVAAIVAIARTFGLRVVAEGVETASHECLVREEGCEAMQGYRIGRPEPLAQVLRLAADHGASSHQLTTGWSERETA